MRGQPGRILVVIPSPVFGGAEAQTLQIARGLIAMGAKVAIAAEPDVLAAAGPALGTARPIPAALRPPEGMPRAAALDWQRRALAGCLATARPEAALVCCPLPTEGFGALQALAEAHIPSLAVAHLVRLDWHLDEVERAALPGLRADWAAVSEVSARRLEALFGWPPCRVAAVPNGIPPLPPAAPARATLGLPEGVPLLAQVGRLDIRKGAQLAPAIGARLRPGQVVLAGDGPLRARLAEASHVHVLGPCDDIPTLLASVDAFLLASEHEGCPLSVLEAARAGCPILATRAALEAWPAAEEMAWIVLRDPDHIAARFAEARRDPAATARRVARARAVAAAWDEAAMIRRTAFLLAAACA
ncbi:glycosyltransferase family 4 protein [Roseococcus sp. SDR]|uniref:glycosyltransferase family 4 protein n=1 Tax=Roseococcus sp. SDR TaxID=2835532 RepID=UPI001BCDA9A8|nr:glycosyltransferase family 4 protein [Roseococcus sp. SDR]MBS7788582.1 glycosyltransferase family 4 protein [Roseococcus sp. SDR]MBV1843896.1 glycosyltransferase family 4 protein [Roseococcus sp. SDR]